MTDNADLLIFFLSNTVRKPALSVSQRNMQDLSIKHTIDIFSRLFNSAELVIPPKLRSDMEKALESLRNDLSLSLEEVEDTVILFGKKVWPYRKAFNEFIAAQEARSGEKILLAKLSRPLRKQYLAFKEQGGSLRDLHTGTNVTFFSTEERLSLCATFIEMKNEIRSMTLQAIKSTEKAEFERRVSKFEEIFGCIEEEMEHLSNMADEEQEYPHLATEIRSQIRGFEFGFSLLGPETQYDAVCLAAEHFHGRKAEFTLKR